MKQIGLIILYFLLLCFPLGVFSASIELRSDTVNPGIGDIFTVEITTFLERQEEIDDITIAGIENFSVFSHGQSEYIQVINWQTTKSNSLTLQLIPKDFWEFTLGPAITTLSGTALESNTIQISVGQDDIIRDSGAEEIADIRTPRLSISSIWLFGGWVLLCFYFLLQRFWYSQSSLDASEDRERLPEAPSYIQQLQELQKTLSEKSKVEFYSELNSLVRSYIAQNYKVAGVENLTLQEILPYIEWNKELKKTFSTSYLREFDMKKDTIKSRDTILEHYLKLLQTDVS